MKESVLFCASTAIHIQNFHLPYIAGFLANGFTVDTMCQGELAVDGVSAHHNLTFDKKGRVFSLFKSCLAVAKLLRQNRYSLISVHTTLAAGICRLALLLAGKRDTVLIYTCHGYLYSMCSGIKKTLGILCERVLSIVTDAVVTMNKADYDEAVRYHYGKQVFFVHGMGVNPQKLTPKSPDELWRLRNSFELAPDSKILLCVAEFSPRKNQAMLLQAAAEVIRQRPDVYFVFAGDGALLPSCKQLCDKLGISQNVIFTGHCPDVPGLMQTCDCVVSASLCEGMPFNVMEGLYFGKQVAASAVRGHLDLLSSQSGCVLFNPLDCTNIAQGILQLLSDSNAPTALPCEYLLDSCLDEYSSIYSQYFANQIFLSRSRVVVS